MVVVDIMDFEKKNYFYALLFVCQTLGISGNKTHIKSYIRMVKFHSYPVNVSDPY